MANREAEQGGHPRQEGVEGTAQETHAAGLRNAEGGGAQFKHRQERPISTVRELPGASGASACEGG
jgi:hypothetical protein